MKGIIQVPIHISYQDLKTQFENTEKQNGLSIEIYPYAPYDEHPLSEEHQFKP
jgi:hypothetical protein